MHTHFASGPMFIVTGLNTILFLTLWRLVWHHASGRTQSPTGQAFVRAALFQGG